MSERHPNLAQVDELPWVDRGNGGRFGARSKMLAQAAGGQRLGCSFYELAPGKRSFPFHYHLANEEALYVLEGEGTVRLGDRELPVRPGDYVAMPVGPAHPHQVINSSTAPLRFLALSTRIEPDIAVYPDSQKVGVLGGSVSAPPGGQPLRQVVRLGESVGYYDGEE
jgi:uncharacterized cupin superfamily protein